MKLLRILLLITLQTLFIGCANQLINLSDSKEIVKQYYESGKFDIEVSEVIDNAIKDFDMIHATPKSAVIFDVDETALSSYEYAKSINFGYDWNSWNQWIIDEKSTVMPDVKRLYDYLITKNISVIFLTGRTREQCDSTYGNLTREGYINFDTLICRSPQESKMSTFLYKSGQRKILTEKGYSIIGCVGDQESDLEGENTGLKVKIPNYLYKLD